MAYFVQNRYRGKLIVVEGIDGSGKSTQISLLSQWMRSLGVAVAFSEWNSSPLVRETTRRGKKKQTFTPTTFSLIHATDFADRTERYITPMLKAGAVVCADRYAYTAFARDVSRGVDRNWVRNLYRFSYRPNLAFYFRVPLEVALGRILGGRTAIKYYEAGMDLGLSKSVEESFRLFQGRILEEYEAMATEMGFYIIDATRSIEDQQQEMREIVMRELGGSLRTTVLRSEGVVRDASTFAAYFYREPLPGVDQTELQGKLIVIEGPDAVGRTTQIIRLQSWLENRGHAVLHTGMARSALAGKGIQQAKEGHTFGPLTMTLFYATDFADRLENEIIPALRAGFVVLTDRYIFSLFARAVARGGDRKWIEHVAGIALVPHLILYMRAEVKDLVSRVVVGRGAFDYWESGMDMRFGSDMHGSFVKYQTRITRALDNMASSYNFTIVDASKSPDSIFAELQKHITKLFNSQGPKKRALRATRGRRS